MLYRALTCQANWGNAMKIVGFEAEGGLRLGIVEGDQVIDLQAADPKVPTNLGDALAANNGDLKALGDIAKRAPASARRPLKGLEIRLAGRAAGQDPLPRAELSGARQGRLAARQYPEIPDHLHALPHLDGAARAADRPAESLRAARLRSRDDAGGRQARQASHDGRTRPPASRAIHARTKARCANSSARPRNGTWARISTAPAASARGW